MDPTPRANTSRITVTIGDDVLDVVELTGREHLSEPAMWRVTVEMTHSGRLAGWLGHRAVLRLLGPDGHERVTGGSVVGYEEVSERPGGRVRAVLALAGALWRLGQSRDWRVLLGHDIEGVVRDVLSRGGMEEVRIHLSRTYPVRPWVSQLDETDLEFLQRQLAQSGVFAYSTWSEEGRETVVISDHAGTCPYVARGTVRLVPPGGFGWPGPGLTGTTRMLHPGGGGRCERCFRDHGL